MTDNSGKEWMVYEAYPMIVPNMNFNYSDESDETFSFDNLTPYSLKIYVKNAMIQINSLEIKNELFQNPLAQQLTHKLEKDLEKAARITSYIDLKGWNWNSDTTSITDLFYEYKKVLFGEGFNLLGLDYYSGGVFNSPRFITQSVDRSDLTKSFDWRKKHDADLASSFYWDHYPEKYFISGEWRIDKNGWVTRLRNQNNTWACSIFSSIASLSAIANLYYNVHLDYEHKYWLSERQVYNCTPYHINNVGCDPSQGKDIELIYKFFTHTEGEGVITNRCYPWRYPYCDGFWNSCDENDSLCENPDTILFIDHYQKVDLNAIGDKVVFIKENLIKYGPLTFGLNPYVLGAQQSTRHAVSLVGFETDPETGALNWILKNSWGEYWGQLGYFIGSFSLDEICDNLVYIIETPITTQPTDLFSREKYDYDHDGYWNWGIGEIPDNWIPTCSSEPLLEDWNDNNSRIGPCDDNYVGIPVHPEMQVKYGIVNGITINNGDIINISGNSSVDNFYTFQVFNDGNAQLNFQKVGIPIPPHAYIDIDYQNHPGWFEYYGGDFLDTSICMFSNDTFKIKLNRLAEPGDLAHIHIYVNEPDIDDFEFTLIFNGCETQGGIEEIDNIVSWSDLYRTQLQDVHIVMNGELTVTGTVFLSSGVDIVVERGGKLIINGGILTASCGDLWNGVDIWGNAGMPQESFYQGTVELLNNGTIEFADTAISTYKITGTSTIYSGGLIHSEDAFFTDNFIGVCLAPYTNPNGGGNRSYFRKSEFRTTDNYYKPNNVVRSAPKCGVQMSWVNGVNFEGCIFLNDSKAEKRKRGCGILNMDADFHVKNACVDYNQTGCEPTIPCRFEGLDYGIKSLNAWSFRRISVESADFIDNMRSIYLSMNFDASLIHNNFELNAENEIFKPGDTLIGIYTDGCSRYQIEQNSFIGDDPDHFELVGMHILNSGEEYNEVYNNIFENLDYGIIAAGKNKNKDGTSGLCIKCNDFTKCWRDVFVTPGGYDPRFSGIATTQGHLGSEAPPGADPNSMGAGNTYTKDEYPLLESNYYNSRELNLINYTHQPNTDYDKLSPSPYINISLTQDNESSYSKEHSCPSHLNKGEMQLQIEKDLLQVQNNYIILYQDTLNQFVDGGDTPGLNFDILTSFPEDGIELRQKLLDESPYLSDTVLKSAIEKEEVLVNPMIRDIMVANPQSAKSADLLESLASKGDPLPDHMMDEIMEGFETLGGKEKLERKLAVHQAQKDISFANIIRYYKDDTASVSSQDSILSYLENYNSVKTAYQTIFCKLSAGDTTGLFSLLNEIPVDFSLDQNLLNIHYKYADLYDILSELQNDSVGIDSSYVQSLSELIGEVDDDPGIFARNILIYNDLFDYSEPVFLADNLKVTPVNNHHDAKIDIPAVIKIYPNPAGNYFIIAYDLRSIQGKAIIKIVDMEGRNILNILMRNQINQQIIDTKNLPDGLYFVNLYNENQLIEAHKISIIK